ncbi:D-alanyl-D-alanine dipeptidase [Bradyrhizobium sp. LM2.7]
MKTTLTALLAAMVFGSAHAQSLPGGFVYLRDIDPTIIQDIRYATSNNFVGRPLSGYGAAECVVMREVGMRLRAVQQETGGAEPVAENVRLLPAGASVARHGRVVAERPRDRRRAALQSKNS